MSDLTDAADSGDAYAQGFLALCHLHGDKGLYISHLEARFFAENSASRGHWLGNFVLGYLSRFPPIGPDSSQVAKYLLKSFRDPDGKLIKQAAVGDPVACYVLAEIFLSEEIQTILQPDMKMAADYYDFASKGGYLPAFVQSALIRIHGLKDALNKDKKGIKEGIELLQREWIRNCLPLITTLQPVSLKGWVSSRIRSWHWYISKHRQIVDTDHQW